MIRAAICEDDKFFIKHVYAKIRTIFDNFQEEYILDCFVSGKDFLEKIRERVIYDLVFLDIDIYWRCSSEKFFRCENYLYFKQRISGF